MELTALLAVLAQRFRVVVDKTDRHQMAAQLTMHPRFGLRVRLEDRRATQFFN
jgi:hypothetical protein